MVEALITNFMLQCQKHFLKHKTQRVIRGRCIFYCQMFLVPIVRPEKVKETYAADKVRACGGYAKGSLTMLSVQIQTPFQ